MAPRGRQPGFQMSEARFYVYAIHDGDGLPVYIGKGCGRRLSIQKARFGRPGYIVRRFKSEQQAFKYEKRLIAELPPELNRCEGGFGGRATRRRPERLPKEFMEMERLGTRVYAARMLLKFDLRRRVSPEQIERLRQVASVT